MNATPTSEESVYFDAPIAHVHMADTPTKEFAPALYHTEPSTTYVPAGTKTPRTMTPTVVAHDYEPKPKPTSHTHSRSHSPSTTPPTLSDSSSPEEQTDEELAEARDIVPNGVPSRKTSPGSIIAQPTSNGLGRAASLGRASSIGKRSLFTNADGQTLAGSTFINGAGTVGPNATAEQNESLHRRAMSADAMLSEQQRTKIAKSGGKSNKQLAKIIKQEAKVEKKSLNLALKELYELQKIQKTAVKHEAKAQAEYTKTLSTFQKHEVAFLAARAKYEASQAMLNSNSEALEVCRSSAQDATAAMQEKSSEVDGLRKMLDVDEKEREVKLVELTGKSSGSRFSMFG